MAEATEETFETRRWRGRDVRVFAAMDTMPQIAERILGVVGTGRVMNKVATYVHSGGLDDLSGLDHATGLKVGGHAGHPDGYHVWQKDDQAGIGVYLTHQSGSLGTLEGFGVSVLQHESPTEAQVRQRYHKARTARRENAEAVKRGEKRPHSIFDERTENLTYVEIHGFPGQPHREDRIEVLDWNQHGVLRHTIITFVEPDYCDSGRVEETNHVILGYRKPYPERREDEEPEVVYSTTDKGGAEAMYSDLKKNSTVWDFIWLAEEKVTRERRSVR